MLGRSFHLHVFSYQEAPSSCQSPTLNMRFTALGAPLSVLLTLLLSIPACTVLVLLATSSAFAMVSPLSSSSASALATATASSASLLTRNGSEAGQHLNLTKYPDAITELNETFAAILAIPDGVLKDGNDATTAWLTTNGYRGGFHPDSFWHKTECALAIIAFLGSNFVTVAKVIKIKRYIKSLGSVAEAVELMLKCSTTEEMLREGGTALVNLVAEIVGIPEVWNHCK